MTSREPRAESQGHDPLATTARSDLSARVLHERNAQWPLLVLVFVAAVVLLVIQWRRPRMLDPLVGLPLPPLEAAGWINSEQALSTDDLRGEVVLLDFWMTTCGP